MSVLLTCNFRAHRSGELELRKDYSYRRVNFFESLMRDFLTAPALPIGLGETAREGVPMSTAGFAHGPLAADQAAPFGAVLLTAVAPDFDSIWPLRGIHLQ
jgi:hypothetical protein